MLRRLADEAPLIYAVVAAVGAAAGLGEAWQKVIVAVLALLFGLLVRSVTTSPSSLAGAVGDAATRTAAQLTETTVGVAGEVPEAAANVVGGVVNEVVGAVGGLAGSLAKGGL
jgi:hypothetical protein